MIRFLRQFVCRHKLQLAYCTGFPKVRSVLICIKCGKIKVMPTTKAVLAGWHDPASGGTR